MRPSKVSFDGLCFGVRDEAKKWGYTSEYLPTAGRRKGLVIGMSVAAGLIRVTSRFFFYVFLAVLPASSGMTREPHPALKYDVGSARIPTTSAALQPTIEYAAHTRGEIRLAVANNGTFGTYGQQIIDPYTGEVIPSCEYPKNSNTVYLWVGAFWIGAVVGRDTLVSTGTEDFYVNAEFWPDPPPFGGIEMKSIDVNSPFYAEDAYSEEDIYCEYTDTITDPGIVSFDQIDNRPHIPLNIKVRQRSMSWSYSYADDFILFDYLIENIGKERLNRVYMGIWIDGDVWHTSRNGPEGWNDDIVGFFRESPAPEGCGLMNRVDIAYTADNDGDPFNGSWDYRSTRNVVGARVVRTPSDSLDISYNWWIINYSDPSRDFGPRMQDSKDHPYRQFADGRKGTPTGDRDKYYVLSNREFDYDLLETGVDHTQEGFQPPPPRADTFAYGYDTRYLLSFGPFDVDPGQHLPISFAWVGGMDFHQNPTDFENLFTPQDPEPYYRSLNFDDFALNARWASWVYDNPGVDTDSDGYAGKFSVCDYGGDSSTIDTFWYEGDGVPDFCGAGPPPAPKMRVVPTQGKLIIRWNGYYSETTKDVFLQEIDFEGYRVYVGLDDRRSSLSLMASYDREDYDRYVWKIQSNGMPGWVLEETPFTLDELREQYNNPDFDPMAYTRMEPLSVDGKYYYFEPQDFNVSELSESGIHKVYPDARDPGTDTAKWAEDDLTLDYGVPLPKYYEYEYVFKNTLPTVPYCVAVTAFDYGSPGTGIGALETSPLNNMITEYAQVSADTVEALNLDAYVYPNPYRIDGNYAAMGYENRDGSEFPARARRIHFANLPNVCTISIYTLDGDLVRRWEHNYPEGGPEAMHDSWDLITRNTQAVVSGVYYWTVEGDDGRVQIGSLVIIL